MNGERGPASGPFDPDQWAGLTAENLLDWAVALYGTGGVVLASSLGEEDQVLTDMLLTRWNGIEVLTLDTGRLFPETYTLMDATMERYRFRYRLLFPDPGEISALIADQGLNGFYSSTEARKRCCAVRKLNPLEKALSGKHVWITGQRRDQSASRSGLRPAEWDNSRKLIKLSPLYDWSLEEVRRYLDRRGIPANPLHGRGYVSIGCQPCTRPVRDGDDIRSGRWWWESGSQRECGLHSAQGGTQHGQTGSP